MRKSVVPFKSHPMMMQGAWMWDSKAQNAIMKAGGWDMFKQAHAWVDEDAPKVKASYKLPHHMMDGGKLSTKWSGVKAAMGALMGARGGVDIPAADKKAVYNHLVKHYKEFKKEPPEFKKHIWIEAICKAVEAPKDDVLKVSTPWGEVSADLLGTEEALQKDSMVAVGILMPEDGSLKEALTSENISRTMIFVEGESVSDEVSLAEDLESELEKMRHKRGPKPTDKALVDAAKESTDGVVILMGRGIGTSYDKLRAAAFDSRMDEDQREHVLSMFMDQVPSSRKAAGGVIYDAREDMLFATDSFSIVDPVKDYIYCSEDLNAPVPVPVPVPEALEETLKSDTKTFFVPFAKVAAVFGKDMIIRSVAYPSDRIDAHGEFASFADLEKAAHEFNIHFREINIEHTDKEAPGTALAESYMARSADGEISADKGDWCVVLRVSDEDVKSEIAAGVYKGLSIEGRCKKQPGLCKGQSAVQLTGIAVYKISLVENPATRLAFVAKRKEQVGSRPDTEAVTKGLVMDELKKLLDLVQTAAVDLGRLVKAEIPVQVPEFPFQASEEAAKAYMMKMQMSFITKFLGNIKVNVESIQKQVETSAKQVETLNGEVAQKTEQLDGLGQLCSAYEQHPDIDAIRRMIIGEKAPAAAGA